MRKHNEAIRVETGIDKVKIYAPLGSFEVLNKSHLDYAPSHEKQGKEATPPWIKDKSTGQELSGRLYHNFGKYGAKIEASQNGLFLSFNPSNVEPGGFGLITDTEKVYEIASRLLAEKSAAIHTDISLENWKLSRVDLARQIVHDDCRYGDYISILDSIGGKLKKPTATYPTSHTWSNSNRSFQSYSKTEHLRDVYGVDLGFNVNRFEARFETGKAFKSTVNMQDNYFNSLLSLGSQSINEEWVNAAKRDVFSNGIQLEARIYSNESHLINLITMTAGKRKVTNKTLKQVALIVGGIDTFLEASNGESGLKGIVNDLGFTRSQTSRLLKDFREIRQKSGFIHQAFSPETASARYHQLRQKLQLTA
jgi:hypothetical protein